MYKEYREMSRTEAVEALYQDMAAQHRTRFRSIHVCSERCSIDLDGKLTRCADPKGRRDPEPERRQATIHQATHY